MSYANPAPPEDAGADLRTNDDFRRVLLASRPAADAKKPQPSRENAHKKRPQASRSKRPTDDGAATERYRDRARERRERNDDENTAGDAVAPAVEARGVFEHTETDAETDARARAVAESKFLGGDVSRTHLVKGLDFALLRKVRDDIADAKAMRAEESERAEGASEGRRAATFRSVGARALYEFVTREGGKKTDGRAKALASGAVSYSFDLSASSRRDVPTTLHRSTDDDGMAGVRALRAYVDPDKDAGLLIRLGKLMHYLALGSEKAIKKFRRDERRAAEEAKAAERAKAEEEARRARESTHVEAEALSDEDIFADAGKDYEPTIPTQKADKAGAEKSKSFFGDERAGGEASAPAPKAKEIAADDYVLEEDDGDRPTNAFGAFGDYAGDYGNYDVDYGMGGFDKRRDGDDPASAAEAEKKEALRKKRQLGNELHKIRSMMKEQFGEKDDVAFEGGKKSAKRAKKSNDKSNDD